MNRLERHFQQARAAKRKSLVVYLCAGDPDLATTERLVPALAEAGADIIELGVPFSDPLADGPTIQLAAERARLLQRKVGDDEPVDTDFGRA